MVALEAMAAGVPLVVTRVGGLPHVVGSEAGVIVEPESAQALATGLLAVRNDTGLAEGLVAAAQGRLELEFGLDPWLDRHEELYDELATSR